MEIVSIDISACIVWSIQKTKLDTVTLMAIVNFVKKNTKDNNYMVENIYKLEVIGITSGFMETYEYTVYLINTEDNSQVCLGKTIGY